jgi:hypothetical protein
MEQIEYYTHSIGVINVEGWGDPFLVVTEDRYINRDHQHYNYYKLGVSYKDPDAARFDALVFRTELNIDGKLFTPEESQHFLLTLQKKFPNAKIARSTDED